MKRSKRVLSEESSFCPRGTRRSSSATYGSTESVGLEIGVGPDGTVALDVASTLVDVGVAGVVSVAAASCSSWSSVRTRSHTSLRLCGSAIHVVLNLYHI